MDDELFEAVVEYLAAYSDAQRWSGEDTYRMTADLLARRGSDLNRLERARDVMRIRCEISECKRVKQRQGGS